MHIGSLPDGSKGFDANQRITKAMAADAVAKGYAFAMRYVRRAAPNGFDLSPAELSDLTSAGLAVGVVQHVARPGWVPSRNLGAGYGAIAAEEARSVGFPPGVTVFCDLEGISSLAKPSDTIAFANAWHEQVAFAGYHAGLYVGDSCGLTAEQLYRNLRFDCYWLAYNLSSDQVPVIRGGCMRQHIAHAPDWITGLDSQTMDLDTVQADAKGGTPHFLIP
jgi:hypothetical protein